MKCKTCIAVLVVFFSTGGELPAQSEPANLIEMAVSAYKAEGPEAFIKKCVEGGPIEGNKEALAQANMLRSIEAYYGSYEAYEIVQTVEVTTSTRFVYLVLNYANGPLFAAITFFRGAKGWNIVNFKFHTEAVQVWPGQLLSR